MISAKISLKCDTSELEKLLRQIRTTNVDVGWLDNTTLHWTSTASTPIPVSWLASHLHEHTPWADTFMFSETRTKQVSKIVEFELDKSFGSVKFTTVANRIGKSLSVALRDNIDAVSYPSNSPEWIAVKGNSEPLEYGSLIGKTPNLMSEIKWEVNFT
jgi:hypothetical protein